MKYCKNYCEEKEISTSKLNEVQKTLYYIAENMKMDKSISEEGYKHFQMAIKSLEQESVLDKIKAEFISLYPKNYAGEPELGGSSCEFSLNKVLKIIDKYMAESEDME